MSRSASGSTTSAPWPPSSSERAFRRGAAQAAICSATRREPVKATLATAGWVASASPTSGPSPVRQLTRPGGSPARSARSHRAQAARGASIAGFTTTAHPAASAGASFQTTSATGKFQGVMAATTPERGGAHPAAGRQGRAGQLLHPQALGLGGEVVDHLGRARDLGLRLAEGLAGLAVHQLGEPGLLGVERAPRRRAARARARSRGALPTRAAPRPRRRTARSTSSIVAAATSPERRPVTGRGDGHPALGREAPLAGDQRPLVRRGAHAAGGGAARGVDPGHLTDAPRRLVAGDATDLLLGEAACALGVGGPHVEVVHVAPHEAVLAGLPEREGGPVAVRARRHRRERAQHPQRPERLVGAPLLEGRLGGLACLRQVRGAQDDARGHPRAHRSGRATQQGDLPEGRARGVSPPRS